LVEDVDGKRVVHAKVTVREEILVLLHSFYREPLSASTIAAHLNRRSAGSVGNELRLMWKSKQLERSGSGYSLTRTGLRGAIEVIARETNT